MSNMRYALRSADITTLLAWSVETGTEVTQYEAVYIGSDVIARPAKIAEMTGAWLADATARPGGKQRVDAVYLPMYNLDAAINVRLQGNNTNVWTSPTFDQAITIPTYRGDGFPIGAWLDITALTNYTTAGFAYWRLAVLGTNSAAVALKVKLLSGLLTLDPNISWGATEGDEHPLIEHRTDYKVTSVYDLGIAIQDLVGDLDSPDLQKTAMLTLWYSTRGRVYPFVLIPDGAVNDARFVRFVTPRLDRQLNVIDRSAIRVGFEEVSRGLIL